MAARLARLDGCRAVVLDGPGCIGLHHCDRLLRAGCVAVCVDDRSTDDVVNVGHLADDPRYVGFGYGVAVGRRTA